jgi:alkylation response protein AidB-like acyl-CoA dehydrogenase
MPQGDGTYRLWGSKAFITYGEHDYTDNIEGGKSGQRGTRWSPSY